MNFERNNKLVVVCICLTYLQSYCATSNKTMTIQQSLIVPKALIANTIVVGNENTCLHTSGNVVIDPENKLLANDIQSATDAHAIIALEGTTAIANDKQLLVNEVQPHSTLRLEGTTRINGDISVATIAPAHNHTITINADLCIPVDKTLMIDSIASPNKQTIALGGILDIAHNQLWDNGPTLGFLCDTPTPLIGVTFKRLPTNDSLSSSAVIDVQLHGIATVTQRKARSNLPLVGRVNRDSRSQSVCYCDIFINFSILVGPGETFQNSVITTPQIVYCNNKRYSATISELEISFIRDATTPLTTWVYATFHAPISIEGYKITAFQAVPFFAFTSANIDCYHLQQLGAPNN